MNAAGHTNAAAIRRYGRTNGFRMARGFSRGIWLVVIVSGFASLGLEIVGSA